MRWRAGTEQTRLPAHVRWISPAVYSAAPLGTDRPDGLPANIPPRLCGQHICANTAGVHSGATAAAWLTSGVHEEHRIGAAGTVANGRVAEATAGTPGAVATEGTSDTGTTASVELTTVAGAEEPSTGAAKSVSREAAK